MLKKADTSGALSRHLSLGKNDRSSTGRHPSIQTSTGRAEAISQSCASCARPPVPVVAVASLHTTLPHSPFTEWVRMTQQKATAATGSFRPPHTHRQGIKTPY
mmetsp:Transcript_47655/g.119173  ORF Transcript_47655/g.119173 Transcript_47655/m.119173 type:complete len:103 (-) Transcript_47655:63-371(-)